MGKTVIIGGVAGGASCAARLRRIDESAEIIILERGDYISYANCGLPYFIGDVIKERDSLLLQTPEKMKERYNINVRVKNEVTAIDKEKKQITVRETDNGNMYTETYDTLVIATGSSPMRPPIPGIDSKRIKTLWTIPDMDDVNAMVQGMNGRRAKTAAVIGGGFIGLEMAENLKQVGVDVSVVEMLDQVMAPIDFEMAQLVHENIVDNGVNLILGDGVESFQEEEQGINIRLKSGKVLQSDIVILSIGIRPNSALAKDAGLELNKRGGIITDEYLRTSDSSIYAVGDVIEVTDFIFKDKTMIPLAGPANKQGRIAADNIAGDKEKYIGSQGTSVAQVFDLGIAATGANEKTLIRRGLQHGKDYERIIIEQNNHAGYYPGAVPMTMKVLFDLTNGKILGAQIVGSKNADKSVDIISTVIRLGGTVEDLAQLDLAYAPPYSSAKAPVNMIGFTAGNVRSKKVKFSDWDSPEKNTEAVILDVREEAELAAFTITGAVNIPLGQLRDRLSELPKDKQIIVICAMGVRSYNGARILMNNGFKDVLVYPGGTRFYRSTHYKKYIENDGAKVHKTDSISAAEFRNKKLTMHLDCSGLQCPGPLMKVYETMGKLSAGDIIEVSASDPGFAKDIAAWCKRTGNILISREKRDGEYVAMVQKGVGKPDFKVNDNSQGKTIIVFSGDLDKVLASFIIANGAAAMGRPVTLFFTFWGLCALRKSKKQPVKKSLIESMFGMMLPRGSKKLKLSRMNFGGMGSAMMKKIMRDKNVDSLNILMQKAKNQGVKLVACSMSMDVMGIKKEELIDGVEIAGVGSYLGDAEESNVNLFV